MKDFKGEKLDDNKNKDLYFLKYNNFSCSYNSFF